MSILTLNIKGLYVTLVMTVLCYYAECHAQCRILFIVILNVVMLGVVALWQYPKPCLGIHKTPYEILGGIFLKSDLVFWDIFAVLSSQFCLIVIFLNTHSNPPTGLTTILLQFKLFTFQCPCFKLSSKFFINLKNIYIKFSF